MTDITNIGVDIQANIDAAADDLASQLESLSAVVDTHTSSLLALDARIAALEGVAPPPVGVVVESFDPIPAQTTITVSWTCDQPVTGQVRYGTSPTSLDQVTTPELTFNYSSHLQTISGLLAGTTYYVQAFGANEAGDPYETPVVSVTTEGAGSAVTYTDYSLIGVTSFGGYPIDPTGAVDSAAGINAWIAAQPNGTSATNRARYIFPANATYRMDGGPVCIGDKRHVTLWGHAATSSAWLRGDASVYPDVGTTIRRADIPKGPHGSAFITGVLWTGDNVVSWNHPNFDVVIRGFDIICPDNPFPGTMCHYWSPVPYNGRGAHQSNNSFELEYGDTEEVAYCRSRGMAGDFVRLRYGSRNAWVHHCYVIDTGRMFLTAVANAPGQARTDALVESCTADRAGYWIFDLEPEDESNTSLQKFDGLILRNCRFGTSGDGGFTVIGGTTTPSPTRHIADVAVTDNVIDGYGYGNYPYNSRSMRSLIAHIADLSSVPVGQDPRPQNVTFSRNVVTHGETYPGSSVLTARGIDGLIVTGNDANYGGSDWLNDTGCTGVVEGGNE